MTYLPLANNSTSSLHSQVFPTKKLRSKRGKLLITAAIIATVVFFCLLQQRQIVTNSFNVVKQYTTASFLPHQRPFTKDEAEIEEEQVSKAAGTYLEPEWEWARDVSIVYTWVNGSEPEYKHLRAAYGGVKSVGTARDRDTGDLLYSFRTLATNMPWHTGNIYLVSPLPPHWLDQSNPRLIWVNQDDLVPKEFQPTFSSNCIEQFLHLLPGLTDQFIQMNDDYMIYSPVHPRDLFTVDRGVKIYFEKSFIKPHGFKKAPPIWLSSVFNTYNTLKAAFAPNEENFELRYLQHAPFIYQKKAFEIMHEKFADQLKVAATNKFRSANDVLTPLLHHGIMTQLGNQQNEYQHELDYELVSSEDTSRLMKFLAWNDDTRENQAKIDNIIRLKPKFFNINDGLSNRPEGIAALQQLKETFEKLFGNMRSPFEKEPSQIQ